MERISISARRAEDESIMKIHGLTIVKDEADVIRETLEAACQWCDYIYVFDNGSIDGTWELIQEIASQHPQVVPFAQKNIPFTDGLRADIFNAFKDRASHGDWWCRLDSDEFYIDDPRLFVAKIPERYSYINTASFSYYFTEVDAAAFETDPAAFLSTPVTARLRYYVNHWGEPRFLRHNPKIRWERSDGGWPRGMFRTLQPYPVRIWVKHFAYRSPPQIEQRLRSRRGSIETGTAFSHEAVEDWSNAVANVRQSREGFRHTAKEFAGTTWRDRVVPSHTLCFDSMDRHFELNEQLMPPMRPKWNLANMAARIAKRSIAKLQR